MLKKEIEKIEKKIENTSDENELISLKKYLRKLKHSNKLITIEDIREMIANAPDDKLKLIIESVFEEDYDGKIQFSNAVFASIHVLENMCDGDEYVMTKVYTDIYKILNS